VYRFRQWSVLVVVLLAGSPAWAGSLDEARVLQEQGRTEEALAAIESLLGSDASGDEKAAGLDLLGTIAVEKDLLTMAKQAWTQLSNEYPDYAENNDIGTKLLLVSALLKSQDSPEPPKAEDQPQPTPEPAAEPTAVVAPAPTAVSAPATESEPAEAAAPAPPALPKPEPDVAPAPVTTAAESSGVVLVAAKGRPYDAIIETNTRVVAFLREQGVDAVNATGGVPVVESSEMVLPFLLHKGKDEGAGSVLLVNADYVRMQKITTECYLPAGAELWKFKVSGGTGVKGRPYSATGITEALLERYLEKLGKKVGGPGLPVTLK
jgi:outer membrane biosynthesis protein TonB